MPMSASMIDTMIVLLQHRYSEGFITFNIKTMIKFNWRLSACGENGCVLYFTPHNAKSKRRRNQRSNVPVDLRASNIVRLE